MFSEEMLVWIGESRSDSKDHLRNALRGERAICRRLLVQGKRVSAITAL